MKSSPARKERFIVDANGERVGVVLDLATYHRLREAAEENADLQAYRAAKARAAREVARGEYTTLAGFQAKRSRKAG